VTHTVTPIRKYYNSDGDVAVLYSPGFGTGWSSSTVLIEDNDAFTNALIFDARLVRFVKDHENKPIAEDSADLHAILEAIDLATATTPDELSLPGFYTGGARDLTIAWLKPGTNFLIYEYGGAESIQSYDDLPFRTA